MAPEDLLNLFLYGGLALISVDKFGTPESGLIGPIGLKLATTAGGLGSPSQMAGIGILTILGIAGKHPPIVDGGLLRRRLFPPIGELP